MLFDNYINVKTYCMLDNIIICMILLMLLFCIFTNTRIETRIRKIVISIIPISYIIYYKFLLGLTISELCVLIPIINIELISINLFVFKELFWYSLVVNSSFYFHVIVLVRIYEYYELKGNDYICFLISRISFILSLSFISYCLGYIDFYGRKYIELLEKRLIEIGKLLLYKDYNKRYVIRFSYKLKISLLGWRLIDFWYIILYYLKFIYVLKFILFVISVLRYILLYFIIQFRNYSLFLLKGLPYNVINRMKIFINMVIWFLVTYIISCIILGIPRLYFIWLILFIYFFIEKNINFYYGRFLLESKGNDWTEKFHQTWKNYVNCCYNDIFFDDGFSMGPFGPYNELNAKLKKKFKFMKYFSFVYPELFNYNLQYFLISNIFSKIMLDKKNSKRLMEFYDLSETDWYNFFNGIPGSNQNLYDFVLEKPKLYPMYNYLKYYSRVALASSEYFIKTTVNYFIFCECDSIEGAVLHIDCLFYGKNLSFRELTFYQPELILFLFNFYKRELLKIGQKYNLSINDYSNICFNFPLSIIDYSTFEVKKLIKKKKLYYSIKEKKLILI